METQTLIYLFVGLSFALYIGIALWSRAGSTKDFYVAGGGVNPVVNGMVLDPAMQAGSRDKFLSLDHTEVMIVRPFISFAQMRLIVGAIFVFLGVVGLLVIGQLQKRGRANDVTA